jgi:hypothetical protein
MAGWSRLEKAGTDRGGYEGNGDKVRRKRDLQIHLFIATTVKSVCVPREMGL